MSNERIQKENEQVIEIAMDLLEDLESELRARMDDAPPGFRKRNASIKLEAVQYTIQLIEEEL